MATLNLVDALGIFNRPSGSFLYHLLVLLAVGAVLGMAWGEWQHSRGVQARRLFLASGGLLLCRLPYLVVALGARLDWVPIETLFPPLERLADVASIGLVIWAFLAADQRRERIWDLFCVANLVLAVGIGATFVALWSQAYLAAGAALDYNLFWQSRAWSGWQGGLLLLSLVMLAWRRKEGWSTLFAALTVMLAGRALQLLVPTGLLHVPQWERLGNLVAYPLVAAATYQRIVAGLRAQSQESQALSQASLDQIKSMLSLFEASHLMSKSLNLSTVLGTAVEGVARALDADLCAVAFPTEDEPGQMHLPAVYNPLRQGRSEPVDFPLDYQWAIQEAMRRRGPVLVEDPADSHAANGNNIQLRSLYGLLGSTETGPLLVQPLLAEEEVIGVIIVGNVRSKRPFTANEAKLCQAMAEQLVNAIQNARRYRMAQGKVEQLATEQAEDRRAAQQTAAELQGTTQRLVSMTAELEALREARNALETRLLESRVDSGSRQPAEWQEATIGTARRPGEGVGVPAGEEPVGLEAIGSILEDLRTPATTVVGYSDLLLSEAMGGMAEVQRKFLRRIKASAERMIQVLNRLIREAGGDLPPSHASRRTGSDAPGEGNEYELLTDEEQGAAALRWQVMDINELLEKAVAACQSRLQEKSQTVTLNLTEDLPAVLGAPDQILQVLSCLLSNASLASPAGGRIRIQSTQSPPGGPRLGQAEHRNRFVAVSVQDSGRGLSEEALAQVFEWTRPPRTPPGLGESGSDLARSRVLVEAHGGYLWVESERDAGWGATFTLALPLSGTVETESGRAAEPSRSRLAWN